MLNLIKMDFYRLCHSKAVRIGAIVAAILAFSGMLLNLGIVEIIKFAAKDNPESAAEMGMFFNIAGWIAGVDFAQVVLTGTESLSLFVACMIVASFIGAEQSCGYIKNIAGQLRNRGTTVISKYIVTCAVHLMVLVIYTVVALPSAKLLFASYITTYSIGALIESLLLRFLLYCAINAILVFFCTLTKSHAVAMVAGAILSIGVTKLAYLAASSLLSMVKIDIDIAKLMPDGINGILLTDNVNNIAIRGIVVSLIFIVGFLTAAVIFFKKRDVK